LNFSFIHAADLHLGSPLLGLAAKDAEIARRFAAASREAFSDLVTRAIEREVSFLVIAGDIYDGEWKDASIGLFFNREMARLARKSIPVYVVRGNHDADSVVTKSITLPDNVHEFSSRKVETLLIDNLQVALHGRSFPNREVTDNWAITYPAPKAGWFNIGVLHTSCDGREGHASYAPCTPQDLTSRAYDYFALGHVHEFEIISRDPWVVFPGNLQGRSIRECGPKGAVLVQVSDGRVSDVERLSLDRARFASIAVDLSGIEDEPTALTAIESMIRPFAGEADGRLVAIRLRLTGATPLHRSFAADQARMAVEAQAAAHRCHEEIWLEKLSLSTHEPARPTAGPGSSNIDLAALLAECRADPDLRQKIASEIALLASKMPGQIAPDQQPDDLEALIAEAESLVLGRALGTGAC
jgi:exonuclease SbcD